jgi:signal transduction histidine kinase
MSRLAFAARLAFLLLGAGAAAGALALAEGPARSTTYAGTFTAGAALILCAGLGLLAAGALTLVGRGSARIADLALASGFLWFAPVWVAWQEGPALVRSVAAGLGPVTFPLLVHLILAFPSGRLSSAAARALAGAAYAEAVVAALLLALFREPYLDQSCWANCTVNSFLLASRPSLVRSAEVVDRWFVAAAAVALAAVWIARLARMSPVARRLSAVVAVAALGFTGAVVARAVALQRSPVEDPFDTGLRVIFAASAGSVILLAAALVGAVVRRYAERRAVAHVVASLDEAPEPGALQAALAGALADPKLRIAYRLSESGRYVDASGRAVADPEPSAGHTLTRLTRNERTIAVVSHAGATPDLESRLGRSILLALENERLQAEVLAQLDELRASRARLVEVGDLERQRLERDLHDGAQQRLLALSYDLRVARSAAQAGGETRAERALSGAIDRTLAALDELRELAHGIFPAILAEAGLGAALSTLADDAPLLLDVTGADGHRYPSAVETAAYFAIVEAVDDAAGRAATHAAIRVAEHDGRLLVTVEDDGAERASEMSALVDRVGALGGSVAVGPRALQAEIPCA